MKELMGLAVLSLPVLALLGILVVGIVAVLFAVARQKTRGKKWIAGVATAVLVILIPTWDEILGRLYFDHLCVTAGGVKVYRRVQLPAEYWNTDGNPVFLDTRGNKIASILDNKYVFTSRADEQFSKIFRIRQYTNVVTVRDTNELLGTHTSYSYFGGWLRNATSLHVSGRGCHNERNFYARFLRSVFMSGISKGSESIYFQRIIPSIRTTLAFHPAISL